MNESWLHDSLSRRQRLGIESYQLEFKQKPPEITVVEESGSVVPESVQDESSGLPWYARKKKKRAADYSAETNELSPRKKLHWASDDSRTSAPDGSTDGGEETSDEEQPAHQLLAPGYVNSKFACFNPTPIDHFNKGLVEELSVIERAREMMGETRSALSYRRAIASLKAYPRDVTSAQEGAVIENVGPKIANMIREYLNTGQISEAEQIRNNSKFDVLEDFMNIYGVGSTTARHWYAMGYRTVEDVVENEHLSEVQMLGVKYYDDFKEKLTRKQVEAIIQTVTNEMQFVDKECVLEVVGGYRRGKPLSGDVDIVIAHPVESKLHGLLDKIVRHFQDRGNITAVLSITAGHGEDRITGSTSGMDALDKALVAWKEEGDTYVRRVDFIVPPWSQRICAVLGWMGSKQYERSLRDYARKKRGYRLSSHTLLHLETQTVVPVKCEKEIFEILKVPHFPPELRNA